MLVVIDSALQKWKTLWYSHKLQTTSYLDESNLIPSCFPKGQHPSVAESAVVGYPHDIKGEGVYAYVILKDGFAPDGKTEAELRGIVRQKIAAYALPDVIQVYN